MYAFDTPHAKGHQWKKYQEAGQNVLDCLKKLHMLARSIIAQTDLNELSQSDIDNLASRGRTHHADLNQSLSTPACAAFVSFEYSESMARCVEDYRRYYYFPMHLFTPKARARIRHWAPCFAMTCFKSSISKLMFPITFSSRSVCYSRGRRLQ